jgi:hypothetical protein
MNYLRHVGRLLSVRLTTEIRQVKQDKRSVAVMFWGAELQYNVCLSHFRLQPSDRGVSSGRLVLGLRLSFFEIAKHVNCDWSLLVLIQTIVIGHDN